MYKTSSTDKTTQRDYNENYISEKVAQVLPRSPLNIINILHEESDFVIARVLDRLPQPLVLRVLNHFPGKRSQAIVDSLGFEAGRQWSVTRQYPVDSVGRLICKPHGVFSPDTTVHDDYLRLRGRSG